MYDDIIANYTYTHFDMYRLQVDWVKVRFRAARNTRPTRALRPLTTLSPRAPQLIADYVAAGGSAADVIEPVDGFHPSQTGNYLLADVVWNDLLANKPSFLGAENANNAAIIARFGDQGGYV